MSYLLDTDICSHHLKRDFALAHRFNQFGGRLYLSAISLAELHVWSYLRNSAKHRILIAELVDSLHVLVFDEACADMFGNLKGALSRQGLVVPPVDLMIAATARVHGLTLVTHNTADFARVPDLKLDDWLAE